jgi:hypothetical protein
MGFGIRSETIIKFFEQEHIHPVVLDHVGPSLGIAIDTAVPEVKIGLDLLTEPQ